MTTGYTAAIAKDITFNDFVMHAQRPCFIMAQSQTNDTNALERIEPGSTTSIKVLTQEFRCLRSMTKAEIDQATSDAFDYGIFRQAETLRVIRCAKV